MRHRDRARRLRQQLMSEGAQDWTLKERLNYGVCHLQTPFDDVVEATPMDHNAVSLPAIRWVLRIWDAPPSAQPLGFLRRRRSALDDLQAATSSAQHEDYKRLQYTLIHQALALGGSGWLRWTHWNFPTLPCANMTLCLPWTRAQLDESQRILGQCMLYDRPEAPDLGRPLRPLKHLRLSLPSTHHDRLAFYAQSIEPLWSLS